MRGIHSTAGIAICLFGLLLISVAAFPGCNCIGDDCYEDVVVSGAGYANSNGRYKFIGMTNDRPSYRKIGGLPSDWIYYGRDEWNLNTDMDPRYDNDDQTSDTPPATGWHLDWDGVSPSPTLSGGRRCIAQELTIVPLGAAGGILDRSMNQSEASDGIMNSFQIFDGDGNPTCGVPLHVCVYQIDASTSPPTKTLVDYRYAPCNPSTREYKFEIPAYAMFSSKYDVVLSFSNEPSLDLPSLPSSSASILPSNSSSSASSAIAAVYEIGEPITGSCQVLDGRGMPTVTSFIHIYLYSIDPGTRPETKLLVTHHTLRVTSGTSIFHVNVGTDDLAAGLYELLLGYEDGTSDAFRIRIADPA